MALGATVSSLAYAMKRVYTPRRVENAVYEDNPLLAMIPKEGGFTGQSHVHALRNRDNISRGVAFAATQTLAGTAAGVTTGLQFLVTRVKNYQVYTLDTEVMLAGRDDKGSFLRSFTTEVDSALNNIGRDTAIALYRDGSGDRGQVSAYSNPSGTIGNFTMGDAIANIEVGMTVCFSTGSTKTAALRNSGGGVVVASVDRDAGTFTTATNPDSGAAGDWVFVKGDRQAAAITLWSERLKLAGLDAWVPSSAPASGESFFGQDRSGDSTRNAGMRIDISTMTPEEGLITGLSKQAREGAKPSHIFMTFSDAKNISLALGSKVETQYTKVGDVGFSTIRVTGPKGDVMIVPDQNAQLAVANSLQLNTWQLKHLGELYNTLDQDGAPISRVYNDDGFEGRIAQYANVLCFAPGKNARFALPT